MPSATWNGVVLAHSADTVMVEGNHYFPPDSVDFSLLRPVDRTTFCPWKGTASYYDVVVDGQTNSTAAWTYRDPKPKASHIRDHIAFWGGVQVG
ncbi:DUF427 domain-containing protein [Egicoccus sp. AB-alg6-2]|uniref:DUF427 domain-containing protein n=1 Tax=Egicoccus sp. AB-alg6-2 TaxID=3242692 RepID=UPI00359E8EE2